MRVCSQCNTSLDPKNFYKTGSKCKECHKAYSVAWRKANPDKIKIHNKKTNKKRWEKQKVDKDYLLKKTLYRQSRKDIYLARSKEWNKNNKDKVRSNVAKSQLKRKSIETFYILHKEMIAIYNSPCAFCNSRENITIDHIIPISRNGRHSVGNLQPLCKSCNSSKNARLISEYKYYLKKGKK